MRHVGKRLTAAQPREVVVGNIVRRVLGLIREVAEENGDVDTNAPGEAGSSSHPLHSSNARPALLSSVSTFSPLKHDTMQPLDLSMNRLESSTSSGEMPKRPQMFTSQTFQASLVNSLFGPLSRPVTPTTSNTSPAHGSPVTGSLATPNPESLGEGGKGKLDLRAEVVDGIQELQDELDQSDDLISQNAADYIHSNEIILTYTSSTSVQRFLLAAAKKREFTVVHAESYPNDHQATLATVLTGSKKYHGDEPSDTDERWKPLAAAGITVVLIPDSHVFAIMSRVNKVIMSTHTVLANGGLIAASGAHIIAQAAKAHQTPVVVVSGMFKLCPVYPFDPDALIEYGDTSKVLPFTEGELLEELEVDNPLYDYVPPDLVDLYITNL